jgi:ABC-type transport system involved in multi-copper enzyme maturation permease subunit
MKELWVLMLKDWRLNRAPVIGAAVAIVGPYLLAVAGYYVQRNSAVVTVSLAEYVKSGAQIATMILALFAAAFGATTFAAERREGWADFLAVVPASWWKIVLSKLIVASLILVAFVAIHAIVFRSAVKFLSNGRFRPEDLLFWNLAVWTLLTFGVAWLLSVFLNSAAVAAVISISVSIAMVAFILQTSETRSAGYALMTQMSCIIGLLCIVAGTVCFSKRISP